ncbi:unnamed protein product [Penicillium salamii]|nr:unnamed protein product [Penicillium salamii]
MSAGAELSCQIDATEMDAATLKLMALADVVQNLLRRSSPGTNGALNLRSKFFEQLGSGGELKMLVNVVNKDACHEIDFLGCA